MKITRYVQSCLLIEEGKARILFDPSGEERKRLSDFGQLDAVFYTHQHSDHFDAELAQTIVEQGIAPVYANASTARLIEASKTVVKDGKVYDVSGVKVKAIELPHCLMADGSSGPQNTGYVINDKLFHPGDGKELNGLSVENLAVPIAGPDISIKDSFDFAKQLKCKNLIPIHYDMMGASTEFFEMLGSRFNLPFKIHSLKNGETVEL